MVRNLLRLSPVVLAAALLAVPAYAEVFHVTLKNGTVIETASRPQQASWDNKMVLLLTDMGNWVGFSQDEIAGIRSEDPVQGFGIRINDKVVVLGLSPNDLPDAKGKDDVNSKFFDLANKMLDMQDKQNHYSIQQFVDPSQTQGIPSGFAGNSNSGFSGNALGGLPNAGLSNTESSANEGGFGAPSLSPASVSPP
jgi:hypothetical protein